MKRTRSFRMIAAGVAVALSSAVVVTTTTQPASAASEFEVLQENLPVALETLLTGLADATESYLATQSFEALGLQVAAVIAAAGQDLVQGSPQFGAFGLGFGLLATGLNFAYSDFLAALDAPETIPDLFTADDLATILANLPAFLTEILEVGIEVVADLLLGEIDHINPFFGVINAAIALGGFGSTLSGPFTGLGAIGLLPLAVVSVFALDYITQVEDGLQSLLVDGPLAIVAAPVAAVLAGFSIPALPVALPFP